MNLFDLLQSQLTPEVIQTLSKQLRTDEHTAKQASEGALSAIVQALGKNASSADGADSLSRALDNDHDGSVLNNISQLFQGQTTKTRSTNGLGILDHILGGKADDIIALISKGSGLNMLKTGSLLTMLAPIVMGALGKQKRQSNLDSRGIFDLLSGSLNQARPQRQELGMLAKVLDRDGDGSVMDELAGMGMKMLGNMFRR